MAHDKREVLKALRTQRPEFAKTPDADLMVAFGEELGETDESALLEALGEELGVPAQKAPSLGKRVLDFAMSVPAEIGKDVKGIVNLPGDVITTAGASAALDDLEPVDYAALRSKGASHEDAAAAVQTYIDELRRRSGELGGAATQGRESATRTAATALSTAAGAGAGGLLGKAAIPAIAQLVGTGAVAGATHGGVTAAGQGGNVGEAALMGGLAGGTLAPAVPAVARFIGRELAPLGRLFRGNPKAATIVASEAIAGQAPAHPAVQRLMTALEEAAPLREAQTKLASQERGVRFGRFRGVGQETSGELGAKLQVAELRGQLPKVDFESLRGKIAQEDVNQLFDIIRTNPVLREGEQARAYGAMWKILGEGGGAVPTRSEIELLNAVYGPKFTSVLLKKQPLFSQAKRLGVDLLNVPRALMSSMDLSAPFRQGAFLIGRPAEFFPAFTQMFRYAGSQRALDALNTRLAERPTAPLMRQANLALSEVGALLDKREEAFIGGLAEKIPVLGAGVRASQRAYVGFLNQLRADTFDSILGNAQRMGHDVEDPRFLKSLGQFINSATGRGDLPGRLDRMGPELATVLFSPRLMASRVNLLNPGFYAQLEPQVRKEALKSAMSAAAVGMTALGLLKASGAQVETDPRSSDFGKARVGDTRFDIFAGFQQYIRLGAQLLPDFGTDLPVGAVKSPLTGRVRQYGRGFHPPTRLKQTMDFAENKLAPVPSMIVDLFRGRSRFPEKPIIPTVQAIAEEREITERRRPKRQIDPWDVAQDAITPLALRDAIDAVAEWGPETGSFMAVPAFFGVGIQTMPSPKAAPSPIPESLLDRVLAKQGRSAQGDSLNGAQ